MEKMFTTEITKEQNPFGKPNHDVTYCTSKSCLSKCWRHASNYEFKDEYYWFMDGCEKVKGE